MGKTATDFPDPGMVDQLRELAEAEPFKPFTIVMRAGDKFHIQKAEDIAFTHFGSPKVRSSTKRKHYESLSRPGGWHVLNVDRIDNSG